MANKREGVIRKNIHMYRTYCCQNLDEMVKYYKYIWSEPVLLKQNDSCSTSNLKTKIHLLTTRQ